MREIDKEPDMEIKHAKADKLLCDILTDLGYEEAVKVFDKMYVWYS